MIDTAEKRKAISGVQSFMIAGVTPNALKDQEWRQESGRGYSGILVGNFIPSTSIFDYVRSSRTRRR